MLLRELQVDCGDVPVTPFDASLGIEQIQAACD